jgi:chemotaxis protein MotA
MDILSLIGMFGAVGMILLGQHVEGGEAHTIVNGAAALIVFGGTTGAVLLETQYLRKPYLQCVIYLCLKK